MAEVTLTPNQRSVSWPPVRWGDGSHYPIILEPGEGLFDADGHLHFFSIELPDGIRNCQLLPQNRTADAVLRIAKEILLPFGLTVASNAIYSGEGVILNLALEVFSRFGEISIGNYLDRVRIENTAYYDLARGWCVIEHPLRMS